MEFLMGKRRLRLLACLFCLQVTSAAALSADTGTGVEVASDETPTDNNFEESVLEEVIVTGSRVRRSNLDSPSPVLVIESSALVDAGITTLGEFARYLPQNADTVSDSASGTTGLLGSAGFNLRGIGLDATLTLVNGRRIAPFGGSSDTSPFVDINAIPVAAIERIEVLLDGASAIYGSEAVAGVVNIILKQAVEHLTFEAGYLTASEGDGSEWEANLTGGWNNASTRVLATMSWFERELIWSRDRAFSREADLSSVGGFNSRSPLSSPPSIRILSPITVLADPACPENSDTASIFHDFAPNGTPITQCRFNYPAFTTLQQPSERWAGTATLWHDFSSGVSAFAEAIYSRNETQTVLAPTPLINYRVRADHPQNPFQKNLTIRYRLLDAGDRGFDTTATTWRLVAGLEGELRSWEWEVGLSRSEGSSESTRFNGVLGAEFQDALYGLGGPNSNQYYNPFGLNPQNPPEVLNEILISGTGTELNSSETSVDAQINGSFGELRGGPIGMAFGGQWRKIGLEQMADPEELSGVILGGSGILPLIDERTVGSVFAEAVLPLLPKLEAQLAVRYDEYNDFGSTTNPKIGIGWRPRDDVLLRATWGTSFRPPTFRELFDPEFEFEGFLAEDPLRCPATGAPEDCIAIFVPASNAGNPELEPDDGETWLLGFAWEPDSRPGLSLSVDFWKIEHNDRIMNTEPVFDFLLANLSPDINPLVDRAAPTSADLVLGIPGVITSIRNTYINASKVSTRGLDVTSRYLWQTDTAGEFQFSVSYTYLDEYSVGISQFGVELLEDWAGTRESGQDGALPHHRGNLGSQWNYNQHSVSALLHYIGSYYSPVNLVLNNRETDTRFKIGAYTQLDLQYSYVFKTLRDATLRLGCQNCTDNAPPVYNYSVVAEAFHEARGALIYVRWSQPF